MIETTQYRTVNGKTTKVEPKTEKAVSKPVPEESKEQAIENNTEHPKEKK